MKQRTGKASITLLFLGCLLAPAGAGGCSGNGHVTVQPALATGTATMTAPATNPSLTDTPGGSATADRCLPSAAGIGDKLEKEIFEGPFTFQIGIFDDPRFALPQVALMPADTSGVPGVGWFHKWSYQGPDIGPVEEMWGDVVQGGFGNQSGGRIDVLKSGPQPQFAGGIVPTKLNAGQRIELGVGVQVNGQSYGAVMSVDIEASGGTLIACNPSFRPWPSSPVGTASPQ